MAAQSTHRINPAIRPPVSEEVIRGAFLLVVVILQSRLARRGSRAVP
jgi:hypothetical protein